MTQAAPARVILPDAAPQLDGAAWAALLRALADGAQERWGAEWRRSEPEVHLVEGGEP